MATRTVYLYTANMSRSVCWITKSKCEYLPTGRLISVYEPVPDSLQMRACFCPHKLFAFLLLYTLTVKWADAFLSCFLPAFLSYIFLSASLLSFFSFFSSVYCFQFFWREAPYVCAHVLAIMITYLFLDGKQQPENHTDGCPTHPYTYI